MPRTVQISQPLGMRLDGERASFGLRSASASAATLVVDAAPGRPERRIDLRADVSDDGVLFTGDLDDIRVGDHYHLLIDGPTGPRHAFDRARPLLDPYARGIVRSPSGAWRSAVVDARFDWGASRRPGTPLDRTIVYEANVRTLTTANHSVPEHLRGSYAGIAHESTIARLHRMGVTAIELLPVHAFATEQWLEAAGRENAWGYNTLGFFAPHAAYASAGARAAGADAVLREFKGMVRLLHEAGIEVFLDVVYNHTAEEGVGGPTSSLRGIDGARAYRWAPNDQYFDTTGCGNTVDTSYGPGAELVLDSLRYWANEVQVDGFRFDLMASLARNADHVFDPAHPLLDAIRTDPALQDVKLIAEPWDVGPDGWKTGSFGERFSEWNDGFRNTVRQFWLGDIAAERRAGTPTTGIGPLAGALTGSRHLFDVSRGPVAGVNFVTAHDGFTLRDLVSYDSKHNEANGEENRDGTNDNRSFNHGIEGPTADRGVTAARWRSYRNLLGTLLLSAGVPMIVAGDESGRTQNGNNNAYVVSDDLTDVSWDNDETTETGIDIVATLVRLRNEHPSLRPLRYGVDGERTPYASRMEWFGPDGLPMTHEGWDQPIHRALQYYVESTPDTVAAADTAADAAAGAAGAEPRDRMLIVVHGSGRTRDFTLPVREDITGYRLAWSSEKHRDHGRIRPGGDRFTAYGPGIHAFEIAELPAD